ncbi:MAG: methyltransferase domain-containing protein, partial [candidate division WOR-3 bacterium]
MQTELKLNIGCFNNPVDGWINIDITLHTIIAKFPLFRELLYKFRILSPERYKEHLEGKFDNILRYDIRKGLPFPDGCCIYIYSSHFIEHLFYPEVEKFFMECYRVLCKGGVRTVVPDFYNYVQKYMNFRKENVGNIILEDCLNDDKF